MLEELLGQELADLVTAKLNGKQLGVVNDGTWIPKAKFDAVNDEKNTFKNLADKATQDLQNLSQENKDNDSLLAQIEKIKADNETEKQNLLSQLSETRLVNALKLHYNGKAHDTDLVISQLDKSLIKLDEKGNISEGLEEQDKALMENKKFLFVDQPDPNEPKPKITTGVGNHQTQGEPVKPDVFKNALSKIGIVTE
jgi:hypothetical protein